MRSKVDRLSNLTTTQWLLIAAVFHISVTVSIFIVGHFRLLPNQFDQTGVGISFSIDGVRYREISAQLADALKHDGLAQWRRIDATVHCRILSLSFVFPGSVVGYNILAAEPINLIYYLGILVGIYLLAREVFDSKSGLVAAGLVAVWPSFLLHSTQFIRDSACIFYLVGLMLALAMLIGRTLAWTKALLIALSSILLMTIFWATRGNLWNIVLAGLALASLLLIVRLIRERKLFLPNLTMLLVIIFTALVVPTRVPSPSLDDQRPPKAVVVLSGAPNSGQTMWSRLVQQLRARREGFRAYRARASNIDEDRTFYNDSDVFKYLPRAAVIGFFAPFPRMWFESGTTGRPGRLLAALETLLMYFLYVPAAICVWNDRRRLTMWLVFLFASVGMIALGLIVVNAGALFRLRYAFWILTIMLAVRGIEIVKGKYLMRS